NTDIKQSITVAIENGIPTLAEGGGFMYLTSSIETTDQSVHNMVGVIPAKVHIHSHLKAIGYREIRGTAANYLLEHGQVAKGHEFHYTTVECTEDDSPLPYAYETKGSRRMKEEGYLTHNVVAGYPQFHFASCPEMVNNWLHKCLQVKKRKKISIIVMYQIRGGRPMKKENRKDRGLTLVYTGDGKGKTTAALGLALRAVGRGLNVKMYQFIKSPQRSYGEQIALQKLGVEMVQLGIGFTWTKTAEKHRQALKKAWPIARDAV